jgi:hypothetical protein
MYKKANFTKRIVEGKTIELYDLYKHNLEYHTSVAKVERFELESRTK